MLAGRVDPSYSHQHFRMLKPGSTFPRALFFAVAALAAALLYPGHGSPLPNRPAFSPVAYVTRGDEVEKNFRAYDDLLAAYYSSLSKALNAKAPDLLPLIDAPNLVKSGYQVLPKLVQDFSSRTHSGDGSVSYSWPWTERMIESERRHLIRSENKLRDALSSESTLPRHYLEKLALDYQRLRAKAGNIDEHVRYNRFWQAAIAADRGGYDRATLLYDDVLNRQEVRAELRDLDGGSGVRGFALRPIRALVGFAGLTEELKTRDAVLTRRIDSAVSRDPRPSFMTVENRPHEWVFRVPMCTDIEDQSFVNSVKQIIEGIWRLKNGADIFRVELDISYLAPEVVYANSVIPGPGRSLDVLQHLRRFPTDGAVLTTGALTTHVQGNAIILGAHSITPRVLAHEFGHILGFRDRYIRGYKDLAGDGFEVLEVVADSDDIMAVPSSGSVLLKHFEMLLGSEKTRLSKPTTAPEAVTAFCALDRTPADSRSCTS